MVQKYLELNSVATSISENNKKRGNNKKIEKTILTR